MSPLSRLIRDVADAPLAGGKRPRGAALYMLAIDYALQRSYANLR